MRLPDDDTPVLALPPAAPRMWLWTEPALRASTCRGCLTVITKGSTRLVVQIAHPTRIAGSGGRWRTSRYYLHEGCIPGDMVGRRLPPGVGARCHECQACVPLPHHGYDRAGFLYAPHSRTAYVWLCCDCAWLPRYRFCEWCRVVHPRQRVSRSISQPRSFKFRAAEFCCDWCAETEDIPTVKARRRQDRADRAVDERYHRILGQIVDDKMFE